MGPSVNVNYYRILLCGVEAHGIDEPVVVLEGSVCRGDGPDFHLAGSIAFQGIRAFVKDFPAFAVAAAEGYFHRRGSIAPAVQEAAAVGGEFDIVPTPCPGEPEGLFVPVLVPAAGNLIAEKVVLDGGYLGRGVIDIASVVPKVGNVGGRHCEAADAAEGIGQIETAVAVAVVGPVDEEVVAAFYEVDGIFGLYPGGIVFAKDGAHKAAVGGTVTVKPQMVLAAVKYLGVNVPAVRRPAYAGNVTL